MSDLIITEKANITAVADNIRSITGHTGSLTLGEMATIKNTSQAVNLDEELDEQDNLIAQIQTALEGKAAGSGSSGTTTETCTVTIENNKGFAFNIAYTDVSNETLVPTIAKHSATTITKDYIVAGNTIMTISISTIAMESFSISVTDCELLQVYQDDFNYYNAVAIIAIPASGTCKIVLNS